MRYLSMLFISNKLCSGHGYVSMGPLTHGVWSVRPGEVFICHEFGVSGFSAIEVVEFCLELLGKSVLPGVEMSSSPSAGISGEAR